MIMSRARDCSSDHQGCRDGDWRWKTRTYLLTCLHDPIMHFLQSSTGKGYNLYKDDIVLSLKRNTQINCADMVELELLPTPPLI